MRRQTSRIVPALLITLTFVGVEALAGLFANSLALLTDAAHNFTDVIALALSWYALRLATRPAHAEKTFGYHRAGILVALVNSTTLVLISLGIFYESYRRLLHPPRVEENVLIGMSLVAFLVNTGTAWLVRRGAEHDLNLRSAFLHLSADALSTLGALAAGVGIKLTGVEILDPLASVGIGLMILWSSWGILRRTVGILLESTPADVDMEKMVIDLLSVESVRGVHDLHVWSIDQTRRALSVHILTDDISIGAGAAIQGRINDILLHGYDIVHATLQLECEGCEPDLLYCDFDSARPTNKKP